MYNNKNLMIKILSIFVFAFILLFSIENKVLATNIGGSGLPQGYGGGSGGSGANCSDKDAYYNGTSGLRISILDGSGRRLVMPVDYYATAWGTVPNKQYSETGKYCSKIEYMKNTCSSTEVPKKIKGGFVKFLEEEYDKNPIEAVKSVFSYLENNNYSNLKKMIQSTGYNCIDNITGTGNCTIEKMNNTYIVVEPMAHFGKNFSTAYEMRKVSTDCWLKGKWGRLASFTTPAGNYFGKYLSDKVNGGNFYDAIKNLNSTNSLTVYSLSDIVNIPKQGTLRIEVRKYNSSDVSKSPLITSSSTNFKVGNSSYNTGNSGIIFTQLDQGNYNLSITKHPSKYKYRSGLVSSVKIESNKETKVVIYYDATCDSDLDEISKTPENLSKLYSKWKVRGLLNFKQPSCIAVSCNYSKNVSCLSGSFGEVTFNSDNVSCFNEDPININGSTAYCLTTFSLANKLGSTNFFAKSGQMPISKDSLDKALAATGTINKKCIVIGSSQPTNEDIVKFGKYSDYVTDIKFGEQEVDGKTKDLNLSVNTEDLNKILTKVKSNGNWYEFSQSVDYYLNKVYSTKIEGKTIYSNTRCPNCRFLGYGIVSKLTDSGTENIPFSIKFTNIRTKTLGYTDRDYTNKCKVTLTPELIPDCDPKKEKCDDDNKGKLNLEFRLIDSSNPFPGKSGSGRKVGSNWCSGTDCKNDNDLIKNIISNRSNSYGKVPSTGEIKNPIYKITLTPDTINKIRDYNKNNPYDDYTLKCDKDGNNCKSTFLEKFGITRLS